MAVCFNDTSDQIVSGGLDNELKVSPGVLLLLNTINILHRTYPYFFFTQVWDLRRNDMVYTMQGHMDTITGLRLSPNGYYLLSNSMDNTGELYT